MSMTASKFSCGECGKSYTWKPELAGKRAKCKCGTSISIPATDPAAAKASKPKPAPSPELEPLPEGFDDFAGMGANGEGSHDPYAGLAPAAAPADGPTCPSCQSPVDASAVICINCGHNLKTGKKLKTS